METQDGRTLSLRSLLRKYRGVRKFRATFPGRGDASDGGAALTLTFSARRIRDGELLVIASALIQLN